MKKNILILMPHMPIIFNWLLTDDIKLIYFLKKVNDNDDFNFILKFHPHHSQIKAYERIVNFDKLTIETKPNLFELIKLSDLVVAFESSSALFDVLLKNKPLIFVEDYIEIFDNEHVYRDFLSKINTVKFDNIFKIFKEVNFNNLKLDLSKNQIFHLTNRDSKKKIYSFFNSL
tara:strand:+ start:35593 stop:36111 length:519 start_codon:yes stop_codon:yes gene_type:complete